MEFRSLCVEAHPETIRKAAMNVIQNCLVSVENCNVRALDLGLPRPSRLRRCHFSCSCSQPIPNQWRDRFVLLKDKADKLTQPSRQLAEDRLPKGKLRVICGTPRLTV